MSNRGAARSTRVDNISTQPEDGRKKAAHRFPSAIRSVMARLGRQRHARTDQLTQLATRRSFFVELCDVVSKGAAPDTAPIAAVFIDLDNFKSINDVHGHHIGDEVLAAAAGRLRDVECHGDIMARNGGDEFVLIITDPERATDATTIAIDLRRSLSEPFEIAENSLHLTASVGVAVHPRGSITPERLLQDADLALFSAKNSGRDRQVIFDIDLAERANDLQTQTRLVRSTLDDERLVMVYQPIVDLNGDTVAVEALARCVTPDGELVLPASFLPGAVRGNLEVRLDWTAFAQSCAAAARLATSFPDRELCVSVNFSPKSISQSNFAAQTLAMIRGAGVNPARICIEITENAAFEAGSRSIQGLTELADAGVRIALDDFGTGYSSLSHLLELPLSAVKIDRSFVGRLHEQGSHRTITRAAVELAESLGLAVVAEGVETQEHLDNVAELGMGLMQGWRFAPGMAFTELVEHLDGTPASV